MHFPLAGERADHHFLVGPQPLPSCSFARQLGSGKCSSPSVGCNDCLSRSAAAQLFMIQSGLISLEANTPHNEENHGATPHLLGITTLLIGGVRTLLDKPHMIRCKPLKTNGWIPKMTPCLKGDIFSEPSFFGIHVGFLRGKLCYNTSRKHN